MASRLGFSGALVLGVAITAASGCGARGTFLEDYQPDSTGGGGAGGGGAGGGTTTSTTSSSTSTTVTMTTTTSITGDAQIISLAEGSSFEGETAVVATAGGTVAAAWIAVSNLGEPYIAYTFSTNDGASWLPPIAIPSPDGRYGSDPVLAADANGDIFLGWVGFHANGGSVADMQVYVAASKPGSFVFGPPVVASDPATPSTTLLDKPWIAVTPKGSVVISYAQFGEEYSLITARSVDFGQTFTRSTVISDPSLNTFYNLGYLCVSQETGRVYSSYLAVQQFGAEIAVKSLLSFTDDDAKSWPAANQVVVSNGENDIAFADPSCTAMGDEVWSTYTLSKDPLDGGSEAGQKAYSIMVRHSTSGGAQFTETMDAADTATAPFALLADLKHDAGGLLDIVYYAGTMDDDTNASFRRARFSFGTNNPPSTPVYQPVILTPDRDVPYWLGDYIGHFVRGNRMYTTYVVNADKTSHVAFSAYDLQ